MTIDWSTAPEWATRCGLIDGTPVYFGRSPGVVSTTWRTILGTPLSDVLMDRIVCVEDRAQAPYFAYVSEVPAVDIAALHRVEPAAESYLLNVAGYETLARVLVKAYEQAAVGKGRDRHANNLPFSHQPMQRISTLLGAPDGMAFQAIKKLQEGLRLPHDAKVKELLGAIVYIAGMIIWLEASECTNSPTHEKSNKEPSLQQP